MSGFRRVGRDDERECGATLNLRTTIFGAIVVAAALLGGLWLFLRHEPAAETLSAFERACVEGQRRAATGQTLPLDDESEAKALAYCTCIAEEVAKRLTAEDLAALGLGRPSKKTSAELDRIIPYCYDRAR